jgi:hypothetical protein
MHTVLQPVDKCSDLAKLFSKNIFFKPNNFANKFYYHKNLKNVIITIFVVRAAETLAGGETVGGRGVGAGSSNELDAARSAQSKSFFLIMDLPGGFLWRA